MHFAVLNFLIVTTIAITRASLGPPVLCLSRAAKAGFNIWGVRLHVPASVHAWNIGDVQKKACLVWLRKFQGLRQIARLKQQRSLSFIFCETQRSYQKIMCIYLLFHWFSSENCIVRSSHRRCSIQKGVLKVQKIQKKTQGQNLFFNKFAGTADVFTYHLNLEIFEHTL